MAAPSVPVAKNKVMSFDSGLPAYHTNTSTHFGTREYFTWEVDESSGAFNRTLTSGVNARPITFSGLPFKTYELALSAGGVAQLADGTYVASATLWGAPSRPPYPHPAPGKPPIWLVKQHHFRSESVDHK